MYFQNYLTAYLQVVEYPCLLSAPQLFVLKDLYELNILIKAIDFGLQQYVREYPDKIIGTSFLALAGGGE